MVIAVGARLFIILAVILAAIASVAALYFYYESVQTQLSLNYLNKNIDIGGIKLGMSENEVRQLWGEGEKLHGVFGGYGSEYKEKKTRVLFSGIADSDLYGQVAQLSISNPEFSVFQIQVGDDREEAVAKLISKGMKPVESERDLFEKGEFTIALRGPDHIENIEIWFMDKDLKDRVY